MYYETIRREDSPYKLWISAMGCPGEHRHADLEIAFCFVGEFDIEIDRKKYSVKEGDLLIIPPMALHGTAKKTTEHIRVLSAILGISFLKNYLPNLHSLRFQNLLLHLEDVGGELRELRGLLLDTVALCQGQSSTAELRKAGNLYKIIASLAEISAEVPRVQKRESDELHRMECAERALELIYAQYNTNLTVEDAAAAAGASTSNFCRIFKAIVGESFHKRLNRHRISCATGLLTESSMQISDIAAEVGFPETKSFCRVFREIMGMTPGEYRRAH